MRRWAALQPIGGLSPIARAAVGGFLQIGLAGQPVPAHPVVEGPDRKPERVRRAWMFPCAWQAPARGHIARRRRAARTRLERLPSALGRNSASAPEFHEGRAHSAPRHSSARGHSPARNRPAGPEIFAAELGGLAPWCAASSSVKAWNKSGMSSRRSRSGGTWISATSSR